MDDLITWLRAQLDERATVALAAQGTTEGRWTHADDGYREPGRIVDDYGDVVTYDEGSPSEEQARHIVDNDPAFVLADVASKRSIIELAEEANGLDLSVDLDRRVGRRDEAKEPYCGDSILAVGVGLVALLATIANRGLRLD